MSSGSIMLPSWLAKIFSVLMGQVWPKGPEGDHVTAGAYFADTRARLDGLLNEFASSTNTLLEGFSGEAAEQYAAFMKSLHGAMPQLSEASTALEKLNKNMFAMIRSAKIMMIGQAILMIQMMQDLADTLWGAAAIPALEAALEKTMFDIATQLLKDISKAAGEAAAAQTGLDTAVQTFDHLKYGTPWNWKETVESAGLGAAGAVVGSVLGLGAIKALGHDLANSLGSHIIQGALNGAILGELSDVINGGGGDMALMVGAGALGGGLGHHFAGGGGKDDTVKDNLDGLHIQTLDFNDDHNDGQVGDQTSGVVNNSDDNSHNESDDESDNESDDESDNGHRDAESSGHNGEASDDHDESHSDYRPSTAGTAPDSGEQDDDETGGRVIDGDSQENLTLSSGRPAKTPTDNEYSASGSTVSREPTLRISSGARPAARGTQRASGSSNGRANDVEQHEALSYVEPPETHKSENNDSSDELAPAKGVTVQNNRATNGADEKNTIGLTANNPQSLRTSGSASNSHPSDLVTHETNGNQRDTTTVYRQTPEAAQGLPGFEAVGRQTQTTDHLESQAPAPAPRAQRPSLTVLTGKPVSPIERPSSIVSSSEPVSPLSTISPIERSTSAVSRIEPVSPLSPIERPTSIVSNPEQLVSGGGHAVTPPPVQDVRTEAPQPEQLVSSGGQGDRSLPIHQVSSGPATIADSPAPHIEPQATVSSHDNQPSGSGLAPLRSSGPAVLHDPAPEATRSPGTAQDQHQNIEQLVPGPPGGTSHDLNQPTDSPAFDGRPSGAVSKGTDLAGDEGPVTKQPDNPDPEVANTENQTPQVRTPQVHPSEPPAESRVTPLPDRESSSPSTTPDPETEDQTRQTHLTSAPSELDDEHDDDLRAQSQSHPQDSTGAAPKPKETVGGAPVRPGAASHSDDREPGSDRDPDIRQDTEQDAEHDQPSVARPSTESADTSTSPRAPKVSTESSGGDGKSSGVDRAPDPNAAPIQEVRREPRPETHDEKPQRLPAQNGSKVEGDAHQVEHYDESPWQKSTFSPVGANAACVEAVLLGLRRRATRGGTRRPVSPRSGQSSAPRRKSSPSIRPRRSATSAEPARNRTVLSAYPAASDAIGEWIKSGMSGILETVEVLFIEGAEVPVKHKFADRMVVLRDADRADAPGLYYTADEWQAFILGVKEGEFDDMAGRTQAADGAQRVIALRDSKDPNGPKLILAIEAWAELLLTIKAGERELPADMRELLDGRLH